MFNKKLIKPIIEEYLHKFPSNALEDVKLELLDNGVHILLGGALPSLRVANVIINVLLRHIVKGEANKFVIYDVSLAVEEIIMNVFHHNYPENLDKVEITLLFSEDNLISAEIADYFEGQEKIDFEQIFSVTPEHKFSNEGRSALLIKKAVDSLEFESKNDKNILRFKKNY